jgi:hypothetical protein
MSPRDAHPAAVDLPAPSGAPRSRLLALLGAAALLSLGSLTLLAVLLLPALAGTAAGRLADGTEAFDIGFAVGAAATPASAGSAATDLAPVAGEPTVTPAAGWWVQPQPSGGILLRSPDRVLTVEMAVVADAAARTALSDAEAAGYPLRSEELASGTTAQHVTGETGIVVVIELAASTVLVEAQLTPEGELADYRPALGELLESVAAG